MRRLELSIVVPIAWHAMGLGLVLLLGGCGGNPTASETVSKDAQAGPPDGGPPDCGSCGGSVPCEGGGPSSTCSPQGDARAAGGDAGSESGAPLEGGAHTEGGGALCSSLGWCEILGTKLADVCPSDPSIQGVDGCTAVIGAWGGGTADTKRNRLVVWGGGHSDYYGNEVYALDLDALTMNRIIDPTTNPTHCVEAQADGHPSSRHTYSDLAYVGSADTMFSFSGAPACEMGIGSDATWTVDMPTFGWTRQDPTHGGPPMQVGLAAVDYDPNTSLVFIQTMGTLWSYDLATNTYSQLNDGDGLAWDGWTAVIDPTRKLFLNVGNGEIVAFDISSGSSYATETWTVTGCDALLHALPGLAYDPVQDRIVGWAGGDTVYLLDPDTKSCVTVTYAGGPGPAQQNGTYGRFAYFPDKGVFAVVNDWQENAYALRLTQ